MRNLRNPPAASWSHFSVSNFSVKICFFFAASLALSARSELTLAENGSSRYQIVISANAIPSERYAAEELQRYLEKLSGAKLPLVTDATPPNSREILIGDNAHLQSLGFTLDLHKLGPEGFALATQGNRLIVTV